MSCLIPQRIINPHYRKLANELGVSYSDFDNREDYYIDVPCGVCHGCLKMRGNMWRLRLMHEYQSLSLKERDNSYFMTYTISNKYIDIDPHKLWRLYQARVYKFCKKYLRHWVTTEFGDDTNRLHLHAIIFNSPISSYDIERLWTYGFTSSKLLTPRRIGYITKYITKNNTKFILDPDYKQRVFTSPGIGLDYCIKHGKNHHQSVLVPFLYSNNGYVQALPRYYRNKIFSEDEREAMYKFYLDNLDDDVIPDPPYYIGKRKYTDYTLYLRDIKKLRNLHYQKYIKPKILKQNETKSRIEAIGYADARGPQG